MPFLKHLNRPSTVRNYEAPFDSGRFCELCAAIRKAKVDGVSFYCIAGKIRVTALDLPSMKAFKKVFQKFNNK